MAITLKDYQARARFAKPLLNRNAMSPSGPIATNTAALTVRQLSGRSGLSKTSAQACLRVYKQEFFQNPVPTRIKSGADLFEIML